jgi:hypothetical protein
MSVDAALLMGVGLLATGIAIGVRLGDRRAGSWAALGTAAVFALGGILALCVLLVSDPFQDGGTIPDYHGDRVLGMPLALLQLFTGLALFYLGPLPLGIAIGTAVVFRRERYGSLRVCLAFLAAPVVFFGSLWMMVLG